MWPLSLILCFLSSMNLVLSAIHPAKRQFSFQDICGRNGVDCHNGWCCALAQECIPASAGGEPECRDVALTDLGLDPITMPAFPYSSLQAVDQSFQSLLSSWSLTISTIPVTATPTSFTGFPSYSDNTLKSYQQPTVPSSLFLPTPTATGAAGKMTVGGRWVVGGAVGMGAMLAI